jgi:hypothetical protein
VDAVNNREREFALREVFREAFINTVL